MSNIQITAEIRECRKRPIWGGLEGLILIL
jgi:hypothetical protein